MIEERAGDQNLQIDRLPRITDIPLWQLVTALSVAFMNASWGIVAFRITGSLTDPASVSTAWGLLVISIFVTYLLMVLLTLLRLNEVFKRWVAGVLLVILIAFIPGLIYPEMQGGFGNKLEQFIGSLLQLSFFVSPEFLDSVLVVFFWRMGLRLSNHWIGPLLVGRNLRLSMLLMIAMGLVASSMGFSVPLAEMFVLLFSGFMAMGAARIASVGFYRGGSRIPFQRSSFLGLSISAGFLIAFVLVLTSAISDPVAAILSRLLVGLSLLFSWVFVVAFAPVFILVLRWVEGFLGRLKPIAETVENEIAPVFADIQTMMQEAAEDTQRFSFADRLSEILSVLLPILGIMVVLLVGYLALRRTRAARLWENLNAEERETVIGSLSEYIRSRLQGGARAGLEALSNLMPVSRVIAAARVRQIYRRLLRQSASFGKARDEADTPLEFLSELQVIYPDCQEELMQITRAYLRVRYGEYPESREEVDVVENAWRHVRTQGQMFHPDEQT